MRFAGSQSILKCITLLCVYVKHVVVIVSAFALGLPGTAALFLLEEELSDHGQNWPFGDQGLFSFAFCCTSMGFFAREERA